MGGVESSCGRHACARVVRLLDCLLDCLVTRRCVLGNAIGTSFDMRSPTQLDIQVDEDINVDVGKVWSVTWIDRCCDGSIECRVVTDGCRVR